MSLQCLTVFQKFQVVERFGRFVPERIAHHVYQYLTEGGPRGRVGKVAVLQRS